MSQLSFCLITPSYAPDFFRCRLLAESIDRFALTPIHHYIIVDKKDLKLFKQLENFHRTIITVESILPWWIQKLPLFENGWFSWKTLPIRNWLVQQIVKLEIANHLKEDVLVFVDSDVTFIKFFDYQNFIKEEKVKLFKEVIPLSQFKAKPPIKWCNTATSLLDLPPFAEFSDRNPVINYVGNFIIWRRDNVLQLHQHIEGVTQKSWLEAIANSWDFSEYMLYGIFADLVLKEQSGHYSDAQKVSHDYWGTTPLNPEQFQQFLEKMSPEHFAVMISAKSRMSVKDYAPLLEQIQLNNQISKIQETIAV